MQSHISEECHATGPRTQVQSLFGDESDDVPTGCLEPDCLDRNLLCSVPIRSERFSYVVTAPASDNEA